MPKSTPRKKSLDGKSIALGAAWMLFLAGGGIATMMYGQHNYLNGYERGVEVERKSSQNFYNAGVTAGVRIAEARTKPLDAPGLCGYAKLVCVAKKK